MQKYGIGDGIGYGLEGIGIWNEVLHLLAAKVVVCILILPNLALAYMTKSASDFERSLV